MSDAAIRAAAAQRLMDDPLLVEALDNIEQAAIDAWKATGALQDQERHIAWITMKVAGRIRTELESIITNGKIAAARVQNPLR